MSEKNFVSYDEQVKMGLVKPTSDTCIEPVRSTPVRVMAQAESAAFQAMTTAQTSQVSQRREVTQPDSTHTGHVRHNDDPVTNAQASLLYSAAYIGVFFIALLAMLIITGIADGDGAAFFGILIGGTSVFALLILAVNRNQGLAHSATGIAKDEIKARVKINDRNAEVDEYQIAADKEVRLAEVSGRIELGKIFLDKMGGNHVE